MTLLLLFQSITTITISVLIFQVSYVQVQVRVLVRLLQAVRGAILIHGARVAQRIAPLGAWADTERLALELGVKGLMNVQWAVKDGVAYILEANPRASRTVPFVSKAVNHPLAKSAARIAAGQTLEQIGLLETPTPRMYSVKEVHLPFLKFKDVLPVLGPEMKSTGESMGIDADPYLAFYRAQLGAKNYLPLSGTALLLGDGLDDVAGMLSEAGLKVIREQNGEELPALLIDVTGSALLRTALERGVPIVSTREGAQWTARAIKAAVGAELGVKGLQSWVSG